MRKDISGKILMVTRFECVAIGEEYHNGGNVWRKRSTRTGVVIAPERYASTWFYFAQHETVEVECGETV